MLGTGIAIGALRWTLMLGVALAPWAGPDAADSTTGRSPHDLLRLGEQIYLKGVGVSGEPLRAWLRGGVPLHQGQAACVTCHRPSGWGSGEGQTVALPVNGTALYQPRDASVPQLAYLAAKAARRPAYTDATLARAIREGVDAAGSPLADPMPRYALDDDEIAALTAYLKTLSATPAPGVDEQAIHFATVVSEAVSPAKCRAMLDVLEAFVRDKNAGTRYETRRAERGPWTMKEYQAYRAWHLHVWELHGSPETWAQQLAMHYERQPVFAVLSGLVDGRWQPVHSFCEENRIPCLFPNTDLPVIEESDFYSLYFSKGMSLEAEVLARHWAAEGAGGAVIQVIGDDAEGVAGAEALRRALTQQGVVVRDVRFERNGAGGAFWRGLLQDSRDGRLVLWLRDADLQSLAPWADALQQVVISSTLQGRWPQVPHALDGKILVVHPFVLPENRGQQLSRVRAWMRQKRIASGDERIQANAYFVATVAADGLMKIANIFSREYFVERIEDMMDDALTRSLYPRVSLAPGQRFVSKGGYVFMLSSDGVVRPKGGWIVP